MKVIENPTQGPRGTGSLEIIDDERVRVVLTERKEDETEVNIYELTYPQGVELVRLGNWKLQNVKDCFIQLAVDQQDIQYIRPNNGKFNVVFSKFGADEGKPPTLRYNEPRDYKGEPWLPNRVAFFALYEIIGAGQYTGMEILHTLTYEFEYDDNLEEFTIVGSSRKKWHEAFMTFLTTFGFDVQHDTVHHPGELQDVGQDENGIEVVVPNVLSEVERILKTRGEPLAQVEINKGWVDDDTFGPAAFGLTRATLEYSQEQQAAATTTPANNMISEGGPVS